MKMLFAIAAIVLSITLAGCATFKDAFKSDPNKKYNVTLKKDYQIKVKLDPKSKDSNETGVRFIVVDNKTGKKWEFTKKEFVLLMDSFDNWVLVANADPEISKVEQDKKNFYITFNYYKITDDGRTKESVLSGIIIIDKNYVQDKTKVAFWRGMAIGAGAIGLAGWIGFILALALLL